jgi:hypothetical protein
MIFHVFDVFKMFDDVYNLVLRGFTMCVDDFYNLFDACVYHSGFTIFKLFDDGYHVFDNVLQLFLMIFDNIFVLCDHMAAGN